MTALILQTKKFSWWWDSATCGTKTFTYLLLKTWLVTMATSLHYFCSVCTQTGSELNPTLP